MNKSLLLFGGLLASAGITLLILSPPRQQELVSAPLSQNAGEQVRPPHLPASADKKANDSRSSSAQTEVKEIGEAMSIDLPSQASHLPGRDETQIGQMTSQAAPTASIAKQNRQEPAGTGRHSVATEYALVAAPGAQPGSFVSGGFAASAPGELPVPPGEAAPVAFFDDEPKTEPQRRALERIQRAFADEVNSQGGGSVTPEVWNRAREAADRQYVKIFGFAAYQRFAIQAAKEALAEKRSTTENP